jgi:hypothetical protein
MSDPNSLLKGTFFDGPVERKVLAWYRKIFSIAEIENSIPLQWVFGALLFSLFVTFYDWIGEKTITTTAYATNNYACWPYFLDCGRYYFLTALPHGYSQTTLYAIFLGIMLGVAYCIYRRDWTLAHIGLSTLAIWKVLVVLVLSYVGSGNYDYYDIVFLTILLLFPHKLFFLRVTFVSCYFLAATIKIHEGWVLGTYFTALSTGLPVFGNALAPFVTNIVIGMQIVGGWFLLSARKIVQRLALTYFIIFHLYSTILVQYRYPATVLPILIILFGLFNEQGTVPRDRKSLVGWAFLALLFVSQMVSFTIPGDQKMTLEGNRFGFYMFEANHQCVSNIVMFFKNAEPTAMKSESDSAHQRCDPYRELFSIHEMCARAGDDLERIRWRFDHSINGGPFYRIVDEEDACVLSYDPFRHNAWIKLPEDNPRIVGYPVKNYYY